MTDRYLIPLNPEPWTAPSISIGRKNGKPYPAVYKSAGLRAYQEGVASVLAMQNPVMYEAGVPLHLRFYFWRQLPDYTTDRDRKARKHEADATNMQKALEDALQGVLFHNDRDVHHVESWIIEQEHTTEPRVLIEIDIAEEPPVRPTEIADRLLETLQAAERERNPIVPYEDLGGLF
jgi:Holliday junction resolvase RusA-like endonuclease